MNTLHKQLILVLCILGFSQFSNGQINYTQPFDGCNSDPCNSWDWNIASGNITAVSALGYSPCAVANPAARANLSGTVLTGNFSSTATLGTSSGEYANFGFSYKVINFNTGAATAANSCTFTVQWATAATGPWTTVETFQNISSTACTPYVSTRFYPTVGQPIFARVMLTRNTGDFWAVIDDISLVQPPPSQILATDCSCNNDQTPNMTDGTYATALRINYNPAQTMASGLIYTLRSSTGLNNPSGGPIGTPTFTYCNGGCPPGIMNGEYYLSVQVQSGGMYSAMVDGPDPDVTADLILSNTTCSLAYPALPMIPIDDVVCITRDTMFASNSSIYNRFNTTSPINLRDGFTQTGTGPLMVDYETFDPLNHNPYSFYLIRESAGCRVSSFKEVEIYKRPITALTPRHFECRKIGSQVNLYELLSTGTSGNGKFFIGGSEVAANFTVNSSLCTPIVYRIEDVNCGNVESTTSMLITIKPDPQFDLSSTSPSPVCMSAGNVVVTVSRTSTGPNPVFSVTSNSPLYSPSISGTNVTLPAPTSKGSVTYNICLTETSPIPSACAGIPLPTEGCATQSCKRYTVYNDGYDCGASNIFANQCEEFSAIPCEATVNPTLELACGSLFSISLPFDIVTTDLEMDTEVIDCTDSEVCGNFNASFLGIDVPGGGGPQIKDLPGIGSLCSIFDLTIDLGFYEFKPLGALYDLLQCDKSLMEIIFDALAAVVGGDGGEWKLVADTDGDGAFDYIVTGEDLGISQGFPSSSDFCVPNNVKGSGTINIRLVAGWPNAPTDVCGKVVTDGISLLELLPLGAIPIVGPIIEDIFATLYTIPFSGSTIEGTPIPIPSTCSFIIFRISWESWFSTVEASC